MRLAGPAKRRDLFSKRCPPAIEGRKNAGNGTRQSAIMRRRAGFSYGIPAVAPGARRRTKPPEALSGQGPFRSLDVRRHPPGANGAGPAGRTLSMILSGPDTGLLGDGHES